MSDQSGDIIKSVKAGDLRAFAKFLTMLERVGVPAFSLFPDLLNPTKPAFRLGITGPPGAGKSTLIGQLIGRFRTLGKKVGVIAVDPSSPFSKGAVLGDRIRYSQHFGDSGVFIRSLGSRGSLGGLSSSAYLMVRAFDLAQFDIVLLETVGVGQTELEIMNVADFVSVVLVPESGDSIQGMKAGLLEIADLFLVNKSDRPGADAFAHELESTLMLDPRAPSQSAKVLKTSALSGDGIGEFVAEIEACVLKTGAGSWQESRKSVSRLRSEAQALLRHQAELEIREKTSKIVSVEEFLHVFAKK